MITDETDAAVLGRFEALGDNCELGLVQRHFGAEPLGLLRFGGFHIPVEHRLERLLFALGREFAGLGDPETLRIEATEHEYVVHERRYGIMYHTFISPAEEEPETVRRQQARHLGFLRSKLIGDLREGSKVFVWKTNVKQTMRDGFRLLDALQRFAENRLLWVVRGVADCPPGAVEVCAPNFYRGHVDRFAPYDNAPDISFDPWMTVCRNAARIIDDERAEAPSRAVQDR
jgi:hypothetical protein